MQALTRRQFLHASGAATATGVLAGLGLDLAPLTAEAQVLRTREAKEVPTVCMYCAVGCGQLAAVENGRIINIEGDPDNPINQGALCCKGNADIQIVYNERRPMRVWYRRPNGETWEQKPVEWVMERIAQRIKETRDSTFVEVADGVTVNRCEGIGILGSAIINNEECYLISKFARALGVVSLEHQARI